MSLELLVCDVDNGPLLGFFGNPSDSSRARKGRPCRDESRCLLLKRFCLGRCLSRLVTNGAPVCFRMMRSVFRIFNGVTRAGDAINKVDLCVCEVDDGPLLD